MTRSPALLLAATWILAGSIALGQQEKPKPAPKEQPAEAKAIEEFKAEAAAYVMRLDSRPREKLVLRDEPLLHWGNPARLGENGALFVWQLDGRPEVIGTVFTYRIGNVIRQKHEYHSLAGGPLVAEFRGQRAWAPRAAGVPFRPVPEAPAPAANARLRLSQMKALAREFSARMVDLEDQKYDLRLVPQPLIRYEPKDKQILDGALF